MHKFHTTQVLPYKASDMFALVMDIEAYPEFLPWCVRAEIVLRKADELIAELAIGYKQLSESYKSRIITREDRDIKNYLIELQAISGPFEHLYNSWRITELTDNSCQVEFLIEFSFKSRLMNKIMGAFFDKATQKMMNAFEQRACKLYSENK